MILSETILRLVTLLTLVSCFDFSKKRREIECSRCLVSRVRGFDFQWRMEAQTRLNSFLLIALHMSRVLHPSFFSQVHMVNTHVFSIEATFFIHFKDNSNHRHPTRLVYFILYTYQLLYSVFNDVSTNLIKPFFVRCIQICTNFGQ